MNAKGYKGPMTKGSMTKLLTLVKSDKLVYQLIFTPCLSSILQLCFLYRLKLDYKL